MPGLPFVDPETASAEVRAAFARSPLKLKQIVAHANGALLPINAAVASMSASPELDPRLRELVILSAAAQAGCEYEWVQHEPRALALGIAADQLQSLRAGGPLDGHAGVVVDYLRDLFAGAGPGDDRLQDVLSGLSVGGLVDAIMLTGIYLTFARVVEAAALAPELPYTPTVS